MPRAEGFSINRRLPRRPDSALPSAGKRVSTLRPGTVLGREWRGRMQRVAVLADGFAWNGKTYPSLSKVAFAITGTRWNGPKFFGLRDKQSKGRAIMTPAGSAKRVRCAIYTRVSTDQGLRAGLQLA